MKILLDENIDVRFKISFSGTHHIVFTVREMKWTGIKNGDLLKLLKENEFDWWIVADKISPISKIYTHSPAKF